MIPQRKMWRRKKEHQAGKSNWQLTSFVKKLARHFKWMQSKTEQQKGTPFLKGCSPYPRWDLGRAALSPLLTFWPLSCKDTAQNPSRGRSGTPARWPLKTVRAGPQPRALGQPLASLNSFLGRAECWLRWSYLVSRINWKFPNSEKYLTLLPG